MDGTSSQKHRNVREIKGDEIEGKRWIENVAKVGSSGNGNKGN